MAASFRHGRTLLGGPSALLPALLPSDLDASAREHGALRRRRGVESARALLESLLAYCASDAGFRAAAALARERGLARMCPEALFRRLARAEGWLAGLLAHALRAGAPEAPATGLRLAAVDATALCGPGAKGTDWRVHALYDPSGGRLAAVSPTDGRGGEGLARHPLGPGDLALGDRGYGHARGFLAARGAGAHVLVRVVPANVRLLDEAGARFDLAGWAAALGGAAASLRLFLPREGGGPEPVRIVGRGGPKGATVLLTSLLEGPSDEEALALYRLRWQVELEFRRLKSILGLGDLPSRGPTARAWILGRLLLGVLAEGEARPGEAAEPDGAFGGPSGSPCSR